MNIVADPSLIFDIANGVEGVADAAEIFDGWGPFPGTDRVEVLGDGELKVGATRRVHLSDGNSVEETILSLNRGSGWSYSLTGFPAPFSYLVREARAGWTLEPDAGTVRTTWVYSFELRSALAWPIAYLIVNFLFVRMMRHTLENIANTCVRRRGTLAAA